MLYVFFYVNGDDVRFFEFQREWLGLGTDDAGRYIKNTRSIPVYLLRIRIRSYHARVYVSVIDFIIVIELGSLNCIII